MVGVASDTLFRHVYNKVHTIHTVLFDLLYTPVCILAIRMNSLFSYSSLQDQIASV